MSLSFGLNPWLLVLCALAAGALTYWTYRRTTPPTSRGRRLLLGGLRFLALFLVLFLLFEPILHRLARSEQPPVVAVLIDDTQSLRLTTAGSNEDELDDPGPTVREALQRIEDGALEGRLRFYAFDRTLRSLPGGDPATALDSLRFEGERTDISAALAGLRENLQNQNLRGIVLLSDGQYNTGRNPLYLAERSPVPIHTVALGDTARQRDVQIRRVTTNDMAYVGTELPVQIGVQVEDYPGETVQVVLQHEGQQLDAQEVTLPEGTAEVPVDLSFTPDSAGLQRFVVGVTQLPGEATHRNNTEAFTVRVLESKRRVLLLGAAPSPDVSAIRQLLARDEDIEITSRIGREEDTFYEGELPDDLSEFDVMVLAGYPGPGAPPEIVRRVAEAAEEGTPLLFFLGRQTDLSAVAEHFSEVLPAAPDQVRSSFSDALFVPTDQAGRHPIFEISGNDASSWQALPPLEINQSGWSVSPDARVLAEPHMRGMALDDPLLVVRRRSGQRSGAFLGAGLWRWNNVPEDLEGAAARWPELFDNLVQWTTTQEDDRPVRVTPAQETFAGSETVRLNGQVYNESLDPVSDASVEVTITGPDGNEYPHQMEALGNGRYEADAGTLPEGTYRYSAYAERNGDSLGTDSGSFAVGGLTLEYRETRANAALMRQIAQRSGGTFYSAQEAEDLPVRLASSEALSPTVVESQREEKVWQMYPFLAAIILLLTAEWVLRKRSGMT